MAGQAQFGDTSVIARVNRLKGEQDKMYRVQILDEGGWSENRHYVGKYVACLKEVGHCPGCAANVKLSQIFGSNIVLYELGMDGTVRTPLNPSIMLWTYGPKVWSRLAILFNQIKQMGQAQGQAIGLPQFERDLMITCENSKFQNWLVDLSFDPALTKAVPGLNDYVMQLANSKKVDLQKALCDKVTADEMQKLINVMPPPDQQGTPQAGAAGWGQRPQQAQPMQAGQVFGGGSPMGVLPAGTTFAPSAMPAPMQPPMQVPQAVFQPQQAQATQFPQAQAPQFPQAQAAPPMMTPQPPNQPSFAPPPTAMQSPPTFGNTGNGAFPAPTSAESLAGNGMMSPAMEVEEIPFPGGPLAPPPVVQQPQMQQQGIPPVVPAQAAAPQPGFDDLVNSLKNRKKK